MEMREMHLQRLAVQCHTNTGYSGGPSTPLSATQSITIARKRESLCD